LRAVRFATGAKAIDQLLCSRDVVEFSYQGSSDTEFGHSLDYRMRDALYLGLRRLDLRLLALV
jgi:hypothetical protein